MTNSRKLVTAAILASVALLAVGFMGAPFDTSARAAAGSSETGIAAERIGVVFASLSDVEPDPALAAAAARVSKGDLGASSSCTGATWPNIDASCLTAADGSPVAPVRTITIGYQSDVTTTVLVRIPASEVATR